MNFLYGFLFISLINNLSKRESHQEAYNYESSSLGCIELFINSNERRPTIEAPSACAYLYPQV